MNEQEVLHRPFDIEVHKKTFINYLEVIIDESGTVQYAIPSHQEKLIQLSCKKLKVSREELMDLCPREYYFNFIDWLCQVSCCIALWNEFAIGVPNQQQEQTIQRLAEERLYLGSINFDK